MLVGLHDGPQRSRLGRLHAPVGQGDACVTATEKKTGEWKGTREANDEREFLENCVQEEINFGDVRRDIATRLPEYREAKRMVRIARARLRHYDFIEAVREQFGPEIADVVRDHSRCA